MPWAGSGGAPTAAASCDQIDAAELTSTAAHRGQRASGPVGGKIRVGPEDRDGSGQWSRPTCQTRPMDPAGWLSHLRQDTATLLEAAERAPAAPVPSCPDWDVTGLVRHTAVVHHWVSTIVRSEAMVRPQTDFHWEAPTEWPDVREWYLEGARGVVAALEALDPDQMLWNWRDDAPAPARFWHRRMAHETAIHRWDAQNAVGISGAFDPPLAVDGIDEYLSFVPRWLAECPAPALHGSITLEAVDIGASVAIDLAPDRIIARWGADQVVGEATATVSATVSAGAGDLELWLTNRRDARWPGLRIEGDRAVVEAWAAVSFG